MLGDLPGSFAIETAGFIARIHTECSIATVGSVSVVFKPVPHTRVFVGIL